jgi:hypothetical protein
MHYSAIAFYPSPNDVRRAFHYWSNKLKNRHTFLGFHLSHGDEEQGGPAAIQIYRLRTPGDEQRNCLIFRVKGGVAAAYFREPKNLLWFFVVEGTCLKTATELESLGVEQLLKRRIPEAEFFVGTWPARPKQRRMAA